MKVILFGLMILGLFGCQLPENIPTYMMKNELQYRGFSVKKPTDNRWFIVNSERNTDVIFRANTDSKTHTIFSSIGLKKIYSQPASRDELKTIVDSDVNSGVDGKKYELISYESFPEDKQNLWGVRFKLKVLNNVAMNSDVPLVMLISGHYVLHPSWQKTLVAMEISERGIAEEIEKDLYASARNILNGTEVQTAPGVAAGK